MFNENFTKLLILLVTLSVTHAQIAYQEDVVTDKSTANLAGRKPLYSPTRCKQYELLYPGDHEDDWVCDCAPAAVFFPEKELCYPAFRQGPCPSGEILVLFPNKIIPECRANPCKVDGQFMIHDKCYEFGRSEPNPCPMKEYTYVLGVDPKTLLVSCVKLSLHLQTRFGPDEPDIDTKGAMKCAAGSRLSIEGKCTSK